MLSVGRKDSVTPFSIQHTDAGQVENQLEHAKSITAPIRVVGIAKARGLERDLYIAMATLIHHLSKQKLPAARTTAKDISFITSDLKELHSELREEAVSQVFPALEKLRSKNPERYSDAISEIELAIEEDVVQLGQKVDLAFSLNNTAHQLIKGASQGSWLHILKNAMAKSPEGDLRAAHTALSKHICSTLTDKIDSLSGRCERLSTVVSCLTKPPKSEDEILLEISKASDDQSQLRRTFNDYQTLLIAGSAELSPDHDLMTELENLNTRIRELVGVLRKTHKALSKQVCSTLTDAIDSLSSRCERLSTVVSCLAEPQNNRDDILLEFSKAFDDQSRLRRRFNDYQTLLISGSAELAPDHNLTAEWDSLDARIKKLSDVLRSIGSMLSIEPSQSATVNTQTMGV